MCLTVSQDQPESTVEAFESIFLGIRYVGGRQRVSCAGNTRQTRMEAQGLGDLPELLDRPSLKIRQREQGIHAPEQNVTVPPPI